MPISFWSPTLECSSLELWDPRAWDAGILRGVLLPTQVRLLLNGRPVLAEPRPAGERVRLSAREACLTKFTEEPEPGSRIGSDRDVCRCEVG